jgi:hypothetical protein
LITAVHASESGDNSDPPLLWLDTLCCPAEDGDGKQLAIQKLQAVYQQAKHVLVPDAGLMAYNSQPQDVTEHIIRIFTSSWMRRLWTLQEGALSNSLYFQFADKAISFQKLQASVMKSSNSVRHMIAYHASLYDFQRLQQFFHPRPILGASKIGTLDQALLYRSVSVPTDEALCIGTLMSLDIKKILDVGEKEDRMQKVWELIAASEEGISSAVIFIEGTKLDSLGWRWALRSLLKPEKSIYDPSTRILRWKVTSRGTTSSRGLRVQYPGYRIALRPQHDNDTILRNPWSGINRVAEFMIIFRDLDTGHWYQIADKKWAWQCTYSETEEEKIEYRKLTPFPLHDVADTNESVLLLNGLPDQVRSVDGIFGPCVNSKEAEANIKAGIVIRGEIHVQVSKYEPDNAYIYQTLERLAMELRHTEITATHLRLSEKLKKDHGEDYPIEKMKDDEEFKASLEGVKQMFRDAIAEVVRNDERFTRAVKKYIQKDALDYIWVMIANWTNYGYVGERLESDQVWFVD